MFHRAEHPGSHDELEDSAQIFILQGSLLYSQIDTELRDGQLAPCIPHGESFKYDINFNYCNISLYTIKQIQIRVLGAVPTV